MPQTKEQSQNRVGLLYAYWQNSVPGFYSHSRDYCISITTVSLGHCVFFAQNFASWGCLCRCACFTFETTKYVEFSQNWYMQIYTKRHQAHLKWLVPIQHYPLKYMISKQISSLKNGSPYETLVQETEHPMKYYKFYLNHCVISAHLTKQDVK
jgi:hypothetical protein